MGQFNTVLFAIEMTGALIIALAAMILLRTFFSRRRYRRIGGKPRCSACSYDMSGAPTGSLKCPECGHTAANEAELRTTPPLSRRRYLVGSLILMLGITAACVRPLYRVNWVHLSPTWILLMFTHDAPWPVQQQFGNNNATADELWSRDRADRLSESARRALARRQFASNPPITLMSRPAWPSGIVPIIEAHPNCLGSRIRDVILRDHATRRIVAQLAVDRIRAAEALRLAFLSLRGIVPEPSAFAAAAIPPGIHDLTYDVEIREGSTLIWSGSSSIRIAIGGTIDDVLPATRDAALDKSVRESILQGIELSPTAQWVGLHPPRSSVFLVFAANIEWMQSGNGLASARVLRRVHQPGPTAADSRLDATDEWWSPVTGDTDTLAHANFSDGTWTVRIRADPELALSDFLATTYWSGSFDLPAAGLVKHDTDPDPK